VAVLLCSGKSAFRLYVLADHNFLFIDTYGMRQRTSGRQQDVRCKKPASKLNFTITMNTAVYEFVVIPRSIFPILNSPLISSQSISPESQSTGPCTSDSLPDSPFVPFSTFSPSLFPVSLVVPTRIHCFPFHRVIMLLAYSMLV